MPIHTRKNQYKGINAHLHSIFQAQGGWSSFHTNFIGALARSLNEQLPAGYIVDLEQSLQIREIHPDTGERIRRPEPDLTIYRTQEKQIEIRPGTGSATLTQAIADSLDVTDDLYYSAVVIYRAEPDSLLGQAVTRIELLSPTNKQGEGYLQYREKRYAGLRSGVALVEIDFLHETPPVVKGLPRYPDSPNSFAYHITVSDPTPSFESGLAQTYGFGVDTVLPTASLPLGEGNHFEFDFAPLYQNVYLSLTAYSLRVDYAVLPPHFERYSPADQEHIQQVMTRVQAFIDTGENPDD